jgi:hypothetical protein
MYKSPIELITTDIASSIAKHMDDNIYQAVLTTGVNVNKEELMKALKYDRDQYDKGYNDGFAEGMIAMKNKLEETLEGVISSKLIAVLYEEMVGKKNENSRNHSV